MITPNVMAEELPDYASLKAQFEKARRLKEKEDAVERTRAASRTEDEKRDNQRRVAFRASHGLLLAFFTWIM